MKITYRQASSGKEYHATFTGRDGIVHNLCAWCQTDDAEVMDWPATWSVTDDARSDGEVRTHSAEDELEMGLALDGIIDQVESDFVGVNLAFSFPDQCIYQF